MSISTNISVLQLGGKRPVVIDPECDLKTTANQVLWGKTCNAGQICVSPDYVLVPRTFQDKFIEALKEAYVPASLKTIFIATYRPSLPF